MGCLLAKHLIHVSRPLSEPPVVGLYKMEKNHFYLIVERVGEFISPVILVLPIINNRLIWLERELLIFNVHGPRRFVRHAEVYCISARIVINMFWEICTIALISSP